MQSIIEQPDGSYLIDDQRFVPAPKSVDEDVVALGKKLSEFFNEGKLSIYTHNHSTAMTLYFSPAMLSEQDRDFLTKFIKK